MFQTFTGSSRRPRQVNLSGRNNNPFAAVQQKSAPSGAPNAVLQAQQERKARHQERERLQAARTIQRRWRGYKARQQVCRELRKRWDSEQQILGLEYDGESDQALSNHLLAHLKVLLRFANPRHERGDVRRITTTAAQLSTLCRQGLAGTGLQEWMLPLVEIAQKILATLDLLVEPCSMESSESKEAIQIMLELICELARLFPDHLAQFSVAYYHTLANLLFSTNTLDAALLQRAIVVLLEYSREQRVSAHEGLVLGLLEHECLGSQVDLDNLATAVDPASFGLSLQSVLGAESQHRMLSIIPHEKLAWLLAYYTFLYRTSSSSHQADHSTEMTHIGNVSILLSNLADQIGGRQDLHDTTSYTPLPEFVHAQIMTLIDQRTISDLMAHVEMDQSASNSADWMSEDAAILASYVLTLLQVFPRRSDEIRMWLYLGSASLSTAGASRRLPAIKFFWSAMTKTEVFRTITEDPRRTEPLLNKKQRHQLPNEKQSSRENEWRVVLIFLELYSFVLKIMDDEEFISGGVATEVNPTWTRQSALELSQVKDLTVFLKNFAFAMYWYTADISGNEPTIDDRGLRGYFSGSNYQDADELSVQKIVQADPHVIPGLHSSAVSYMK